MSIERVTERIISDANAAAEAAISQARQRAEEILSKADGECDRVKRGVQAEVAAKVKALKEGKVAQARLDGAKLLLAEKCRVIDGVYADVKEELKKLPKKQALALAQRLLEEHAEEGDEICFSPDYPYAKEVAALDEAKAKKLKVSLSDKSVDGGFVLRGKKADKDVSFAALVAADKEAHQAELAGKLFN